MQDLPWLPVGWFAHTTGTLETYGVPSQPWQDLAADLMGPLPSGEYVLVVVDYYSRYFEVTSATIIGSLERIFCFHGLPQSLETDNGPQFKSEEFGTF